MYKYIILTLSTLDVLSLLDLKIGVSWVASLPWCSHVEQWGVRLH